MSERVDVLTFAHIGQGDRLGPGHRNGTPCERMLAWSNGLAEGERCTGDVEPPAEADVAWACGSGSSLATLALASFIS